MTKNFWRLAPILILALLAADSPEKQASVAADKQALAKLQDFVGAWRGVGQVRRGSSQGAWIEQSDWAWKFDDQSASLRFTADDGKYFRAGAVRTTSEEGVFQLTAETVDGAEKTYQGGFDKGGKLVLVASEPTKGQPDRVSLRLIANGKRLIVLLESSLTKTRYSRLAEIGYTRKGSGFGKNTPMVECVVTGGKGTIPVKYEGKTYYVCCTGCKDAFNEDPAGVLAEYRARKEAEKKEATK